MNYEDAIRIVAAVGHVDPSIVNELLASAADISDAAHHEYHPRLEQPQPNQQLRSAA